MAEPEFGAKVRSGFVRKLRLAPICVAAIGESVFFGLLGVPQVALRAAPQATTMARTMPAFEAVSVRPGSCPRKPVQFQPGGRILAPSVPARILIGIVYGIPSSAWREGMIGAPGMGGLALCYSIETHAEGNPPQEQMVLMMRSFLADRFKLAAHWDTRQLPIYALILAKPGKIGPLVPHAADNSTCRDPKDRSFPEPRAGVKPGAMVPCGGYLISPGHIVLDATLADLAKGISWYQQIDRTVVDQTGLSGIFEITLDYSPPLNAQPGPDTSADASVPLTIFTALQEQLGLKLESKKAQSKFSSSIMLKNLRLINAALWQQATVC